MEARDLSLKSRKARGKTNKIILSVTRSCYFKFFFVWLFHFFEAAVLQPRGKLLMLYISSMNFYFR